MRVLLVEDNPGDVLLTRIALEQSGRPFTLDVARDGEEALAYLKHEGMFAAAASPDFVILDLNLPRVDGTRVLTFIRETATLEAVPVAVLSSAPLDALRTRAALANCHIEKPPDLAGFMTVGQSLWACWERASPAGGRF